MRERLTGKDWLFIASCVVLAAVSVFVVLNWFSAAFPEASLDLRVDREASLKVAEPLLQTQQVPVTTLKHTTTFGADQSSRVFLERTLGLARADEVIKRGVHLWAWHHRWFKPLQEEEWQLDVAPTGEITGYVNHLPEDRAVPDVDANGARGLAEGFLRQVKVNLADLQLVENSERRLPHRTQRIFTWESQSLRPAGAPYRTVVVVDGNRVTQFSQGLKVPDAWAREYSELRSKNSLAGGMDYILLAVTIICALVVFIIRLRRGDTHIPMLLAIGCVTAVLVIGNAINSFPSALADYDTNQGYATFLARYFFGNMALPAFGAAMYLIVICGSGEVLYRERLPQHLALPRLWTWRALASKRVFRSFVLGYSLVAFFLAYQVVFYIVAGKFGAWAPAEIPYDDIINSRFPWIAVLFAGFFPALHEEFLSRAFSVPFFEKFFRSRLAAIVVAGLVWGFGHSTYPNQPFYIRGVEVGLAGVLLGFLFYRFGLLPLLIWHYTVDALYTALLLFRSGNSYYIVSAGMASLVFAIPMLASIAGYIRNKGFIPDDDLTNATLPVAPAPPPSEERVTAVLPEPIAATWPRVVACVIAVAIAAGLVAYAPKTLDDVVDYRVTRQQAIDTVSRWLGTTQHAPLMEKTFATPDKGFRNWERESYEEGGSPGGFDSVAAGYLVRHGMAVRDVAQLMRTRVKGATYIVRSYTPLQKREYRIEVDSRTNDVIGYHRLQDEKMPGPRLEEAQALAVARGAFATYHLNADDFEVKEALNFQQPARRDWLFHFQEKKPLVADAWRRVTVRVVGNEVAQLATTVKIPDIEYRTATQETPLNLVFGLARLLGGIIVLGLMIAGLIIASRKGYFPWQRPLRWTLALSFIVIANAALGFWQSQSQYDTTVQWQTFLASNLTSTCMLVGLGLGGLFLALVGALLVVPYAFELGSRDVRARLGRSAAIAALTTVAVLLIRQLLIQYIGATWPQLVPLRLNVPQFVAIPLPAFFTIGTALLRAIGISAALGLFWTAVAPFERRYPWLPPALAITALFFLQLDKGSLGVQIPLMLIDALTFAIAIWVVARYILRDNALAYPLAGALLFFVQDASGMLQNHRPDMLYNAIATFMAAIALLLWVAIPRPATARSR